MARPTKPLKQKILDNITVDPETGCWNWTSGKMISRSGGRPRIVHHGEWIMASRAAYIAWNGPIPDDKYACHTCDNGMCCNPAHLFVGSPRENTRDAIGKGRWKLPAWNSGTCQRGHLATPENTITKIDRKGYAHRRCRECTNAWARAKIARNSSKKPPKRPPQDVVDRMLGGQCLRGHEFTEENTQRRVERQYGRDYWKKACKRCKADQSYARYRRENGLSEHGDPTKRYRHK